MNTSQSKPGLFVAIALMTLVNGIFNLMWGIGLILGTFGILLICFPIALLPLILGGLEIAYATKLLANPPQPVQPSPSIAYWEIAAILVGNVFSMVVGILVLIFYNDQTVKDYFAQLNETFAPPPPQPEPAPVQPVESAPEPVSPEPPVEPIAPVIEEPLPPSAPETPAEPEPPAKPKRTRKAAN